MKLKWLFGIVLTLVFPVLALAQLSESEVQDGFVSIFNGENLDQWKGNPDLWRVEEGKIVGETGSEGPTKLTYNSFLIWQGEPVDDFVLRFDIKLTPGGNSGVQYRSWVVQEDPPFRVQGYQGDFDGNHNHSGILYGEGFRGILCERGLETVIENNHKPRTVRRFAENEALKKEIKVNDWNAYEITAKGFTFTNKINGHVMSICTDEDEQVRRESGIIAIQAHVGPPMKVELKNLRLKRIKK